MCDPLTHVNTRIAQASALLEACRSGLLDHLAARGPDPAPAASLGLDGEGTALVLEVLCASGLVEQGPGGWVAAEAVRAATRRGMGDLRALQGLYEGIDRLVTSGDTPARHAYAPAAVGRLGDWFTEVAASLAAALPVVRGTILDVGAGSAIWSLAMLRDPADRVVALDEDHVLPAAHARAQAAGVPHLLSGLAGSLWDVDFAAHPADRVVCANVLHLFRAPEARDALRRMARAVRAGGSLVVVDALDTGSEAAAHRSAYALQLRLRQPLGTVHGAAELGGWMESAGLRVDPFLPLRGHGGLAALVGWAGPF